MFCPNCGNEAPDSAHFCKYCGCKLNLPGAAATPSYKADIKAAYQKNIETLATTVAMFKKTHDKATFSQLFEQTKGIVTKAVCDQGVDGRDVEDVVQQVYLTAYQKLDTLKDNHTALAWFKRVATNKAIDHLRGCGNTPLLSADYTNDIDDSADYIENLEDDKFELPEDVVENTATQQLVRSFIQELPKDQQKFLIARYFAEMNASQIAEAFGIPAGTVRSQLSRARKTLQENILAYSERTGVKLAAYSSAPIFALLANANLSPIPPLTLNAPSLFSTIQEAMQGVTEATKVLGEKSLSSQGAPYTNPLIDEFAKNATNSTSQVSQSAISQSAGSAGTTTGGASVGGTSSGGVSAAAKGTSTALKTAGAFAKMGIGGKIAAGVAAVAIAGATAGGVYFAGTSGLIPFLPKPYEQAAQTSSSSSQNQSSSQTDEPDNNNSEETLRQKRLKLYKEKVQELEPSFSEFFPEVESAETEEYHMPADFKYTLVDVDGDGLEELLVEVSVVRNQKETGIAEDGHVKISAEYHFDEKSDVFIFTTNEDASELIKADGACPTAYHSAHMYTQKLYSINDGNGLLGVYCTIDTIADGITTYTLSNNQFERAGKYTLAGELMGHQTSVDSLTPDAVAHKAYPDAIELDWRDSSDLSLFDEVSGS